MNDPDKTQELPACAPEKREGWNPTPTNPKTPPPPRRYAKNEHPLTRPALRQGARDVVRFGDVEVNKPDAVELPRNKSAAEDASVEAWFRVGMVFFALVVVPLLLAYKWGV